MHCSSNSLSGRSSDIGCGSTLDCMRNDRYERRYNAQRRSLGYDEAHRCCGRKRAHYITSHRLRKEIKPGIFRVYQQKQVLYPHEYTTETKKLWDTAVHLVDSALPIILRFLSGETGAQNLVNRALVLKRLFFHAAQYCIGIFSAIFNAQHFELSIQLHCGLAMRENARRRTVNKRRTIPVLRF